MSRDNLCVFNSRDTITSHVKRYDFLDRLRQYRTEIINHWKKTNKEMLGTARATLLNRAFELLQDRQFDIVTKSGEVITIQKPPSANDIKIAWEIIKSELGEPIRITEKVDDDENKKLKRIEVQFKDYADKNKPKQIV